MVHRFHACSNRFLKPRTFRSSFMTKRDQAVLRPCIKPTSIYLRQRFAICYKRPNKSWAASRTHRRSKPDSPHVMPAIYCHQTRETYGLAQAKRIICITARQRPIQVMKRGYSAKAIASGPRAIIHNVSDLWPWREKLARPLPLNRAQCSKESPSSPMS